jgi:hypothetical protein
MGPELVKHTEKNAYKLCAQQSGNTKVEENKNPLRPKVNHLEALITFHLQNKTKALLRPIHQTCKLPSKFPYLCEFFSFTTARNFIVYCRYLSQQLQFQIIKYK